MHPLGQNGGYPGYTMGVESQAASPPPTNGNSAPESDGEGARYSDINQILDQILNITDQSLDEAQVMDITNDTQCTITFYYSCWSSFLIVL